MRVRSADVEMGRARMGEAERFPAGGPVPSGGRGRRADRRRRGRLLVAGGALAVLGTAIALVASTLGSGSHPPFQAAALANGLWVLNPAAVSDSAALSAIPDSVAVVKDPARYAAGSQAGTASAPSATSRTGNDSPQSVRQSPGPAGGTVTAGDSKAHCIIPDFPGGVLDQSVVNGISSVTGVSYDCLGTFANPMPTWADWEAPWMFSTASDGWDAWLAANPAHQVIMGMDLIPQSVSGNSDPLNWEQPCAAGGYSQYATALARNLVSYGAGSIVIRLGVEANGNWEADYVGATTQEMNDWAQCYASEVTAMRAVPGAHFLFVWNPNVCTANLPLSQWYPGNSYVDIIGVDAYDTDCSTDKTVSQEGWPAYATDSHTNTPNDPSFPSLDNIAAFAVSNGKPLSFPEWGLGGGRPDDAAYVTGMGQLFSQKDFSFESYFDTNHDGIAPLGSSIPNATAAYGQAFK